MDAEKLHCVGMEETNNGIHTSLHLSVRLMPSQRSPSKRLVHSPSASILQRLPAPGVHRALQLARDERWYAMVQPDLANVLPPRVMEVLATTASEQK